MEKNRNQGYYIYVTHYKNHKTGQIINASDYGKKAFKIFIKK